MKSHFIKTLSLLCSIFVLATASANEIQFRPYDYTKHLDEQEEMIYITDGIEYSRAKLRKDLGLENKVYNQVNAQIEFDTETISNINHHTLTNLALASSLIYTLQKAEYDKKLHYLVGMSIGGVVTYIAKIVFKEDEHQDIKAFLAGAGAAVIAGIAKEIYDSKGHGTVDIMDAIYTGVPGTLLSFRMTF